MTWDPVRQYGEALTGEITDWHPPAMAWLWRRLTAIAPGPGPMLVVQLALIWGGLATLAWALRRRGRPVSRPCPGESRDASSARPAALDPGPRRGRAVDGWPGLAWAVLACGLWPPALALTGAILKDCLMAGALLVGTGLLASDRRASRWLAGAVLLFAATLRFNAFTACVPLAVALLPTRWRTGWPRLLGASAAAAAVLLAAMPLADRLIGAEPSGVALSLVIFDLGGITEHAGVSAFPEELDVRDPVAVNHRCYRPAKWDGYSDWVAPECPLGFTAWNDDLDAGVVPPYPFWLRAILAHPRAYAAHRLTHFAINTRLLPLADSVERPVPHGDAPNPWSFRVGPNALRDGIDAAAVATAHTPLGWPIVAIAVALAAALIGAELPGAGLIVPVALSAALYGLGYGVFSVASELRYHLWTQLGALLAAVLAAGDLASGARPARWRSWSGAGLVGAAVLAGVAGRLFG